MFPALRLSYLVTSATVVSNLLNVFVHSWPKETLADFHSFSVRQQYAHTISFWCSLAYWLDDCVLHLHPSSDEIPVSVCGLRNVYVIFCKRYQKRLSFHHLKFFVGGTCWRHSWSIFSWSIPEFISCICWLQEMEYFLVRLARVDVMYSDTERVCRLVRFFKRYRGLLKVVLTCFFSFWALYTIENEYV